MIRFISRVEEHDPLILTAAEAKEDDRWTMEQFGIISPVLMERAALAVVEAIRKRVGSLETCHRILVVAGVGNNGGDGLAVARMLAAERQQVTVWEVGDPRRATEEYRKQRDILEKFPVVFSDKPLETEYTIIVDALFGVGLSREVTGEFKEAICEMNRLIGYMLSVDIPSGIDASTGAVLGEAVLADETVTFQHLKRGLVFYPGAYHAGEITVAPIGLEHKPGDSGLFTYTLPCCAYLPARIPMGNKASFGKVLLVAGSLKMAGAAILAAKAAYRTGAGMVKVISCEENRNILQTAIPEALFGTEEDLPASMDWADVIAIGPGLGKSESAAKSLGEVILSGKKPLLLDADALNLLSESDTLAEELMKQAKNGRKVVMTPHPGELSRWTKRPVPELKKALLQVAKEVSASSGFVLAAKDARTVVADPTGPAYVNLSGNDGLATAGTGDVLAGMIAALLSTMEDPFRAACLGCYLHGLAADWLLGRESAAGMMAGDLPDAVAKVLVEEKGLMYHAENR